MNIRRILPWIFGDTFKLLQQMEQGKVSKHAKGCTKPKNWRRIHHAKVKAARAARIITMRGKRWAN